MHDSDRDPRDAGESLGLNDAQAAAVAHVDGPLLVFAGAGSGKTRVITYRIANLVARHDIAPYRILSVTFTNKAAGEMRERLGRLLGPHVSRDLWVGTFHATCARLLRRHHEAVGLGKDFVIYDDADQRSLMNKVIKALQLDDKRYPPRMLLSAIHKHKQEARTPRDVVAKTYVDEAVVRAFDGYETAMHAANACDFDDLLLHVLRLVELPAVAKAADPDLRHTTGETIRRMFSHVLVDEFQDTNAVQYRLVRALASTPTRDSRDGRDSSDERGDNLAVVGDDDQSIYRWRGADVRNIREFARDFPTATVVKLEQNYRSTQRIVRAALGVISPSRERVPKNLFTENPDGNHVEIRSAIDERDEAAQLARLIHERLIQGWSRREIAVLYRTHAQSRVLEEELRRARLPYRIVGGLRFFDRAEVKDLLGYLRLLVNPSSDVDVLRVVNTPARGIGSTTIDRLIAAAHTRGVPLLELFAEVANGEVDAGLAIAARKKVGAFVSLIAGLAHDLDSGGAPSVVATSAIERSGYEALLQAEDTDEANTRLQNLYELVGSIRDYEEAARAEGATPSITGFLERTALVNVGDDVRSKVDPDDSVTLMTVHAAKGLEFRGVMITGLEEELFPFKSFRDDESGAGSFGRNALGENADDVEEERRLAYVAITRAREELTLFHAATRTVFGQTRYPRPSRFLKDLPMRDVKHVAATRSGDARAIDEASRPSGWAGGAVARSPAPPRAPFVHPQARVADAPQRAPGERYVERDVAIDARHSSSGDDEVRRGGLVRHKRFGEGRILEIVAASGSTEAKIVAEFAGWGTMTVLRRFLELVE